MRIVVLDISKAFDKVWHKGIIYKLRKCGIGGSLLSWFEDYLRNRMQRVVINGQASEWGEVKAGVTQGSVLGPLLFLIYIDDLVQTVRYCNIRLFADDMCFFIEVDDRNEAADKVTEDLSSNFNWAKNDLLHLPLPKKSL